MLSYSDNSLTIKLVIFAVCCLIFYSFIHAENSYAASQTDKIAEEIFETESDKVRIKAQYRKCSRDSDCTAVLSFCNWRGVSKSSEKKITALSDQVKLECKWPKPSPQSPAARCRNALCYIESDRI